MTTGVHLRPEQLMLAAGSRIRLSSSRAIGPVVLGRMSSRAHTLGFTPSIIMSPGRNSGLSTQIRQGDTVHTGRAAQESTRGGLAWAE